MFIGVDFKQSDRFESLYQLNNYAARLNRKIKVLEFPHVDILEMQLRYVDTEQIERIIVHSYDEFENFYTFKQFHNICMKNNIEYSILEQNIHSDLEIPLSFLMDML